MTDLMKRSSTTLLVFGAVSVVFGLIAAFFPVATAVTLVVLWGIYALIDGITAAVLAFSREGRLPLSSVVARLQVHATSVSSTADRLVRDGLVARHKHPHDGRAALLVLTESGRELVERATQALNADVFAQPGLSRDDAAELVAIVARLRKDAGDFADPRPQPEAL